MHHFSGVLPKWVLLHQMELAVIFSNLWKLSYLLHQSRKQTWRESWQKPTNFWMNVVENIRYISQTLSRWPRSAPQVFRIISNFFYRWSSFEMMVLWHNKKIHLHRHNKLNCKRRRHWNMFRCDISFPHYYKSTLVFVPIEAKLCKWSFLWDHFLFQVSSEPIPSIQWRALAS